MTIAHPPGEMVTPEFWQKRADSQAYQRAYSLLAEKIPLNYSRVITDVACGVGRLLAKLYERAPRSVLVGLDVSSQMLAKAEEYLESKKIPVQLEDLRRVDFGKPGVHLVLDNILDTQMPTNISARTFFTFPELGDRDNCGGNTDLLNKTLREGFKVNLSDSDYTSNLLITLTADQNIARMTSQSGKIISTNYGTASKQGNGFNASLVDSFRRMAGIIGLELTECIFREDDEVWSDTIKSIEGFSLPKDLMKGYWTNVSVKKK